MTNKRVLVVKFSAHVNIKKLTTVRKLHMLQSFMRHHLKQKVKSDKIIYTRSNNNAAHARHLWARTCCQ